MKHIVITISIILTTVVQAQDTSEGQLLKDLGKKSLKSGDYYNALNYYSQALDYFQSSSNLVEQAKVINNLGAVYTKAGYDHMALTMYKDALDIRATLNDTVGLAKLYYNIGDSFQKLNMTDLSCDYLLYADSLFSIVNYDAYNSWIQNSVAICYMKDSLYDDALWYFNNSLQGTSSKIREGRIYNNIGYTNLLKMDTTKAKEAFNKSLIALGDSKSNSKELLLLNLIKLIDNDTIKVTYLSSITSSIEWIAPTKIDAAEMLSLHYIGTNNDSTKHYIEIQATLSRRLYEQNQHFEEEFKKYQIKAALAEKQRKQLAEIIHSRKLWQMLIGGGSTILLAIFLYVYYRRRNKVNKGIEEYNPY